ncbi:unnamed protein product, partial [Brassica napus]
ILALTLSLSRDPLFFLSLSRDIFSSSLPLIHRRSTISLSRYFFPLSLPRFTGDPPSLSFHRFSAVHTVDSYFCTRFPTVPEKLCSSLYESHNPASTHLLRCTMVITIFIIDSCLSLKSY